MSAGPVVLPTAEESRRFAEQLESELAAAREKRAATERLFGADYYGKMTRLCRMFPSLREARGIDPWDLDRFVLWVLEVPSNRAAVFAARFVISVQCTNPEFSWIDVLMEEARKARPGRSQLLWDGVQRLKQKARDEIAKAHRATAEEVLGPGDYETFVEPAAVLLALKKRLDVLRGFDVAQAFACWDNQHRDAFLAWANHPFWG